jgi:uncharacterized protein
MKTSSRFLALLAAFALALVAFGASAQSSAGAEPTIDQIYSAANAGQLDRADAMIAQVLKSHPNSAKAHYVKAELAARERKQDVAKQELSAAEKIAPGLPFAKAESVQALRNQLNNSPAPALAPVQRIAPVPQQHSFPWGTLALVALVFVVGIAFLRRRTITQPAGEGYGGAYGNSPAAPYGQTGYGPVYPPGAPQQPSMGSTLGRGLATGLAVGAGVVAAEEIGHRMFGHQANNAASLDQVDNGMRQNLNTDMGGNDFGVADGGSWDDGGGGGDLGGGGDWDS